MNGLLMSNGYSPVSIPAKKQLEYNEKMTRFYDAGDTSEMEQFLADSAVLKAADTSPESDLSDSNTDAPHF